MQTEILSLNNANAIRQATSVLRDGGVIAFPTDTIYGVAALADNPAAINQLFNIKGREQTKAIAVLIGTLAQLEQVSDLSGGANIETTNNALTLARYFWPGALTLVVPRHPDLPEILSPLPTIGVRMPDHPQLQRLLAQTGPLATTSANLSGGTNTTSAQQVMDQLAGRIDLLLDGGITPGPIPSTVVDCTPAQPVVLRQGAIAFSALQEKIPNLLSGPPQDIGQK